MELTFFAACMFRGGKTDEYTRRDTPNSVFCGLALGHSGNSAVQLHTQDATNANNSQKQVSEWLALSHTHTH